MSANKDIPKSTRLPALKIPKPIRKLTTNHSGVTFLDFTGSMDENIYSKLSKPWLLLAFLLRFCCVFLFRNVHPERWTSLSDGQHQWGFDVDQGSNGDWLEGRSSFDGAAGSTPTISQ